MRPGCWAWPSAACCRIRCCAGASGDCAPSGSRTEQLGGPEAQAARFQQQLAQLRATEVALHTDAANVQHYELPPEFFAQCLGPRLKYSSAYYPTRP